MQEMLQNVQQNYGNNNTHVLLSNSFRCMNGVRDRKGQLTMTCLESSRKQQTWSCTRPEFLKLRQ